MKKVLILGITGMLGNVLFRYFSKNKEYETCGTLRDWNDTRFTYDMFGKNVYYLDINNMGETEDVIKRTKPDYIINAIGIIKQLTNIDKDIFLKVNSLFPNILSMLARKYNCKVIQISTDCVFSGNKGNYVEDDISYAKDIYGVSKFLGELDSPDFTIRTSIIGHEYKSFNSLLEWFLSRAKKVVGYSKAIFSGFTAIEIYNIIANYVIPCDLKGLYHVSSYPISKYDLLYLINVVYKKNIEIEKDDSVECDRSLNSDKFKKETGYISPSWTDMLIEMYEDYMGSKNV